MSKKYPSYAAEYRRAATTNRYVHLDDATLSLVAERVAKTIQEILSY